MKKILLTSASALVLASGAKAALLFSQDFAAGGTTATYVNATTPDSGQFNAITTSGGAKVLSITSNAFRIASSGTNSAFASRTTDFSPTPTAIQLKFDFTLSSATAAGTNAFTFLFGSLGTANSVDANASVYSKFGINTTAAGGFIVRDISGSTNGATTFTGTQTLTYVANNSGATITYLAPDGSTESLANDTFDIFVGTSKQLNDRAVTTASQNITDFKFGSDLNATFTGTFDNISIDSIPEPSTYAMLIGGLGMMVWVARRRLAAA